MNITINGETHKDIPEGLTVKRLLERLELPVSKIAVERNLEIVPKSAFEKVFVTQGDRLEIIHFIGGG